MGSFVLLKDTTCRINFNIAIWAPHIIHLLESQVQHFPYRGLVKLLKIYDGISYFILIQKRIKGVKSFVALSACRYPVYFRRNIKLGHLHQACFQQRKSTRKSARYLSAIKRTQHDKTFKVTNPYLFWVLCTESPQYYSVNVVIVMTMAGTCEVGSSPFVNIAKLTFSSLSASFDTKN